MRRHCCSVGLSSPTELTLGFFSLLLFYFAVAGKILTEAGARSQHKTFITMSQETAVCVKAASAQI